jgi:hypothetical protein
MTSSKNKTRPGSRGRGGAGLTEGRGWPPLTERAERAIGALKKQDPQGG